MIVHSTNTDCSNTGICSPSVITCPVVYADLLKDRNHPGGGGGVFVFLLLLSVSFVYHCHLTIHVTRTYLF